MHDMFPQISFWNFDVFVSYAPFFIFSYNIVPNLEQSKFLIYSPNGSNLLNK